MMKTPHSETGFVFMNQTNNRNLNMSGRARFLLLAQFFLFISLNISGQGSGCINGPTVDLGFTSAGTCGLSPVTITGTFGGSAASVKISENGGGSVSPSSFSSSPFVFTYSPKNKDNGKNVTITVTTNDPPGSQCSAAKATLTLRVGSGVSAPVIGRVTNTTCTQQTGSVVFSGLPSDGAWVLTRNPGEVKTAGQGTSTTVSDLPPGNYTFAVANSVGCNSAPSGNVIISSQASVPTLIITNPNPLCSLSTADLTSPAITAGSTSGLTFSYWTNSAATIAYSTPSAAGGGTYYIKGTLSAQCFDIKPVTVTTSATSQANAGTGGHICAQDFKLNATLTAGSGTWTKISGPGNVAFSPDNHQPGANVSVDQAGTYDFAWSVVNNSCISNDVVRVIFHELPLINSGGVSDTTICKGDDIQLYANGTGFFSWTPASLFSNPNISDPVAKPVTSTTLTVTLTDQFGCQNSADVKVNVRERAVANAGPDQVLENQFSTTMNAVLYNTDESGYWTVVAGKGEFFDSTNARASINGLSPERNKFLWTVKNGVCPASLDTVLIVVRDLIIPTLITPNMDGRNDYFVVGGFSAQPGAELVIFDRRGVQVYKNGNYDNSWNGIDNNKDPLPEDTYYYVLKTKNAQSIKGFIVIRR